MPAIQRISCFFLAAVLLAACQNPKEETYPLYANFEDIGLLKKGDPVEVGGVLVGSVYDIALEKDNSVHVTLHFGKNFKVHEDDIASISMITGNGSASVRIRPGQSGVYLSPGSQISETQSAIRIDDACGTFIQSCGGKTHAECLECVKSCTARDNR